MYEKLKTWFKKNWSYFVVFFGGFATGLLFYFSTKNGTDKHIQQLRDNNQELSIKLESMENRCERYKQLNNSNTIEYQNIRDQLDRTKDIIKRSTDGYKLNAKNLVELEQNNKRLADFIKNL